jgi:hypothetical protein
MMALLVNTLEFEKSMLIHTAEGKRSIDEELVLCIDRHRGETA